jgi:sulfur-oxidizing protein SoxY
MSEPVNSVGIDRRAVIGLAATLAIAPASARAADGLDERTTAALQRVTGGKAPTLGGITLDLPQLAENGNSVLVSVTVDSPMTPDDHVRSIHVIGPRNPMPDLIKFHLGPRAGRAKVSANVRLANSQTVLAVAAMSDGTFRMDRKTVEVTMAACADPG